MALESTRFKLDRAKHHIDLIDVEIKAFMDDDPCRSVRELDPLNGDKVWRAKIDKFPPPEWGTPIGDAVHSLRSSLDHMVWELSSPSKRATTTQFPICDHDGTAWGQFHHKGVQQQFRGLSKANKAVIEFLQPYKGNDTDQILAMLRDLSNFDKHRELTLAVFAAHATGESFWGYDIPADIDTGHLLRKPVINGTELKRVGKDVNVDFDFTFGISFNNPGPGQGIPLYAGLYSTWSYLLKEVVPRFQV